MPDVTPGHITKEDVRIAINEIKKSREKITNQSIRDKLNRGSFTTIHKFRKELASNEGNIREITTSDKILSLVEALSHSISEEAQEEFIKKEEDLVKKIDDQSGLISRLQDELYTISSHLKVETELTSSLQDSVAEKNMEIVSLHEENRVKAAKIKEYELIHIEKDNQIASLESSLSYAQSTIEKNQSIAIADKKELIRQHDIAIQSKAEEAKEARKELSLLSQEINRNEKDLAWLNELNRTKSERLEDLDKNAEKHKGIVKEIDRKLNLSLESLQKEKDDHNATKSRMSQIISGLNGKVVSLSSQVSSAEKERDAAILKSESDLDLRTQLNDLSKLVNNISKK